MLELSVCEEVFPTLYLRFSIWGGERILCLRFFLTFTFFKYSKNFNVTLKAYTRCSLYTTEIIFRNNAACEMITILTRNSKLSLKSLEFIFCKRVQTFGGLSGTEISKLSCNKAVKGLVIFSLNSISKLKTLAAVNNWK